MKCTRYRWLVALALTVSVAAGGRAVSCAEKPSNAMPFLPCPDEWLAEAGVFVERGLIPSALIMVETPEWGCRVGTVGYADIAASQTPEPSMRYRVGGVTKLMLTTVILQLEHEKKLELDHTVDQLLGEGLVPNGHKITLRDCLKMRSGLFDYAQADQFKPSERPPDSKFLPEEILFRVHDSLIKNSNSPGDVFTYSETGFLLAGLVIEHSEKKQLGEVFDERIFKPLGMRNSFFAVTPDIPAPAARGYENMSEIPRDCTVYEPSTLGAANAVVSTPFDTFRFFRELFVGHSLLTQRSANLMASLADGSREEDAYGLGLLERVSNRGTWRGCESSIRGYSVMAGYYMQGQAFIMVFVNTGDNLFTVEEIFNNTLRRISGCPTDMRPGNNVTVDAGSGRVNLSWQSGFLYGDTYHVYIGADRDTVRTAMADKLKGVTMIETDGAVFHTTVKAVKPGRTYYWRVEAIRKRPEKELENARKWRNHVRELNQQMPWLPVPENETITGPVYTVRVH